MSGLIFKNADSISNKEILSLLKRDKYQYEDKIEMEEAVSLLFEDTAIARFKNMAIVLGKDIPHSCSFDELELSKLDEKLQTLSMKGDILCSLSHSLSDSYAWSIFKDGKRVSAKSASAGKQLSAFGSVSSYDKGVTLTEHGVNKLIENFIGYSYADLFFSKTILATGYYRK